MKTVSLFFVLLYSGVAFAAPPVVEIPRDTKAVGDYVTLVPKTDAKTISYVGMSGVEPFPSQFLKDAKSFVFPVRGLPDGTYKFKGIASLNDEHTVFDFNVTIGAGGNVDPTPVPGPKPKPDPKPVTEYDGPIYMYIVEETAQRTPAIAGILLDAKFWNDLESKGYKMRPYDKDSPDAKRMKLDVQTDENGKTIPLPYVVMTDGKGVVIRSVPLPMSTTNINGILPPIKKPVSVIDPIKENVTVYESVTYPPVGYQCYTVNGKTYCTPIKR